MIITIACPNHTYIGSGCHGRSLTIGKGGVGVSQLVKEGVSQRLDGCTPLQRRVLQQLGHLQSSDPISFIEVS